MSMFNLKFTFAFFLTLISSCYYSAHAMSESNIAEKLGKIATRIQASQEVQANALAAAQAATKAAQATAQATALAAAQAATKEAASPGILKGLEMVTRATIKLTGSCFIETIKHPAFSIVALGFLLYVSPRFRQFTSKCLSAAFNAIKRSFPQSLFVTTVQTLQTSWHNLNPTREERAQAEESLNNATQRQARVETEQHQLTKNVNEINNQVKTLQEQLKATTDALEAERAHRASFGTLQTTVQTMSEEFSKSHTAFDLLLKNLTQSVETQATQINTVSKQSAAFEPSLETHRANILLQVQEHLKKHQDLNDERERRVTSSNQHVLRELAALSSKNEILHRTMGEISTLIQSHQTSTVQVSNAILSPENGNSQHTVEMPRETVYSNIEDVD